MVQLDFCRSDDHASYTDLLHLDATSVIPPRAATFLLGTSARVLRLKHENRSPDGFEAQTICVPHYSTRVTSSLTARSPSLPEPPFDLHVCHLDSINTITPPCTLALVDVPKCQPLRLVTRPPSPSVQALRPSFIAPSPSARYVPT
jgi:hypothetical protein